MSIGRSWTLRLIGSPRSGECMERGNVETGCLVSRDAQRLGVANYPVPYGPRLTVRI